MDLEEKAPGAVPAAFSMPILVERMTAAVYERLVDCLSAEISAQIQATGMQSLALNEAIAQDPQRLTPHLLSQAILSAYPELTEASANTIANVTAAEVAAIFTCEQPKPHHNSDRQYLFDMFEAPYIGDADVQFRKYLARCCVAYHKDPDAFESPYITVTQSSGFGKSRLMYELAKAGATGVVTYAAEPPSADPVEMKVLYVCARDIPNSSGYPMSTSAMRYWLLDDQLECYKMESRLKTAFTYADAHWWSIGLEWLGMFTDEKTNGKVDSRIGNILRAESKGAHISGKRRRSPEVLRALIVVVDETRSLLGKDSFGYSTLERFQDALRRANSWENDIGVIFGVFVDTNPQIMKDSNAITLASSNNNLKLVFPPFVLTRTLGVFLTGGSTNPFDYKASVLLEDAGERWKILLRMGRPLWYTLFDPKYSYLDVQNIVNFASRKLLCGVNPCRPDGFGRETLYGVAALLCRLGLRVFVRAASLLVANCMATLHYINHTTDDPVVSYPSDHILALGALQVWYSEKLEKFLLPQFEVLIMQGLVDVVNIEEIAARVFLLLTMDQTAFVSSAFVADHEYLHDSSPCGWRAVASIASKFVSVHAFLQRLTGETPTLVACDGIEVSAAGVQCFTLWLGSWQNWNLAFSHFMELTNPPNKDTLWMLLGKRAAGVLLYGEASASLLIPISCGEEVSFVLIRVEGNARDMAATMELNQTFGVENTLSELPLRSVIRVCIDLYGDVDESPHEYVIDGSDSGSDTYVLMLRGLLCERAQRGNPWPFMATNIAALLRRIAQLPWWDPVQQARSDMEQRKLMSTLKSGNAIPTDAMCFAATRVLEMIPFDE